MSVISAPRSPQLSISAFAHTEFQAIQFMPAFVLPQLLLCGLLVERSAMARPLELLSGVLPLTYAYDALARVASPDALGARFWVDVGVTAAAAPRATKYPACSDQSPSEPQRV